MKQPHSSSPYRDANLLDLSGPEFVELLDSRIRGIYSTVVATDMWKALQSPDTPIELLKLAMREVYLEISSYQPHAIEAAITAIAQMPRSLDERTVKAMLRHQAEEFTHGEMALRDYKALGGDVEWARAQRPSPAAYAVASVWTFIAHERDPFAYLGALYPFEGLTPQVSGGALTTLAKRGFPEDALEFVTFHAEEDPRHTALVRALIEKVAVKFPESRESMVHGIDNFLNIYPVPVWQTAYDRALAYYEREAAA
jgi:pyrroloquinoline quinone (PQQ) biosynthesis protein C